MSPDRRERGPLYEAICDKREPSGWQLGILKESKAADRYLAATVTLATIVLYVATLCPTVYVGDSAEFSEAAAVFGIPHPPGYPLYSLLSGLFVRMVAIGDYGFRSNLFSAICGGLSAGALWVTLRKLRIGTFAALAATSCFALGSTYWSQAVCAEVHTLNCLLLVLSLLTISIALERPGIASLMTCGFVFGLAVGHRLVNLIFLPGLAILLAAVLRRPRLRGRLIGAFTLAALSTAVVYLYLPIAASRHPPLNMGSPTTWSRFWYVVSAEPYVRHLAVAPFVVNLGRFVSFLERLPLEIGIATLSLPIGIRAMWRADDRRGTLLGLAWMTLTCCVFSAFYNVLDVQSYFLPALIGLVVVGAHGVDRLGQRRPMIVVLLAGIATQGVVNGRNARLNSTHFGRTYSDDVLRSSPRNAILLSFGDTTTHLLWYRQDVEGQRQDVTTVSVDEIADWYLTELRRRDEQHRIDWPPLNGSVEWISEVIRRNRLLHPICLTQPLDVGLEGWSLMPTGLVFCFVRNTAEPDLATGLEFWASTHMTEPRNVLKADIHIKMATFSYALARFSFVRTLIVANHLDVARSQAEALVASNPDQLEAAIAEDLLAIDRHLRHPLRLGTRMADLLRQPTWEPKSVLPLLEL